MQAMHTHDGNDERDFPHMRNELMTYTWKVKLYKIMHIIIKAFHWEF